MEMDDLRALVAVIESGGITSAARILNRVPSGITTRILKLEENLGNLLFVREKKKMSPTPLGRDLYNRAKAIIRMLEDAEAHARNGKPGGTFRIGAMESALAGKLIDPLARFHAAFRDVSLEIETGRSIQLQKLLQENSVDAIFVAAMSPGEDDLETMKVFDDELMIVAPVTHKEVRKPADLAHTTLLVLNGGCTYRDRLLQWFSLHDQQPCRIVHMTSCQAILAAVAGGMGAAVMPVSLLEHFPRKNAFAAYSMNDILGHVEVKMVWKKNMISGNIRALQDVIVHAF